MTFDVLPLDVTRTDRSSPLHFAATTFVVQRRVNLPLTAVQRGLADRTRLGADRMVDLGTGVLVVDDALQPVAPFSARQPVPTWTGRAELLSARGARVATIEVDVSMWSSESTCVTLRPAARHPERWSARRLRRYFTLAHAAGDAIGRLLACRAIDALAAIDGPNARGRDVGVTQIEVVSIA